ncbi:Spermatogenesis-associated protein 20 [Cytospora mali]|uniref:Spermatogenesis-associated protein 20 n=1 Tax=Cytospora mali TaxID=578113 RepID=A0A194ULP9_CYTMA|nr:Spermatogenesis-associated protein 20 [Valsa mali var. pyri (nom. inval.)]
MATLTNRCDESKSPYVRAHKANPTAWQLWTPETLGMAKRLNKLLFVSIGYSACHWCHVMAHESFDDPRIAELLNENFVPVKIDREERPDIDRQYMDFVTATTGSGGWPLNVFVTPDLEPVFGGTYWPGPGTEGTTFEDILSMVGNMWKENEEKVRDSGKQITQALRRFADQSKPEGAEEGAQYEFSLDLLKDSYQHYQSQFDEEYGGFGGEPKFPTPAHLGHLVRLSAYGHEVKEAMGEGTCVEARDMVLHTLQYMARGGIKDQIGQGFARYSVTRDWSLPHFEKMLYDNAQLLPVYLDAYLLTREKIYLDTVHDIATYLTTSPMASEIGGIHASEDADSAPTSHDNEKREGAFYVWEYEEMNSILNEDEMRVCSRYWGVKSGGNVDKQHDIQGELEGKNTLCVQNTSDKLAKSLDMTTENFEEHVSSGRRKLLDYRNQHRPRPALDDKIVTSWNGIAIGGLARASAALSATGESNAANDYLSGAKRAAACIRENLFDSTTGTLRRVYREGPGETPGFADDYAFLVSGLIDLYEATFDDGYLEWAETLQQTQIRLFWDPEYHGFFSTPEDQSDILVRTKDTVDNAEPGTNGVSAWNLLRLGSLLNDAGYEEKGRQTIAAFASDFQQQPAAYSGLLSAATASKFGLKGLLIAGDGELANAAVKRARESVKPGWTVLRIGQGTKSEWLRSRNELLKDLDETKEMVQLCEGRSCRLLDLGEIEKIAIKNV